MPPSSSEKLVTRLPDSYVSAVPPPEKKYRTLFWFLKGILVLTLIVGGCFTYLNTMTRAPRDFRVDTQIEIPLGYTLDAIASKLETESLIRSPLLFKLLVQHYGKEKEIPAGVYLFHAPASVFAIAKQMALGDHEIETFKITLPEGLSRSEMANVLRAMLPNFDTDTFMEDTKTDEGYLFPDTYFFFATATSGPVVRSIKENFEKKTRDVKEETRTLGKDWGSIIIMASILEEEAATPEDRRIVSGILWKRIKKGMRLQVDATFAFTIGKGSLELTMEDLKSNSPYNTYLFKGLPPTPISNPGLDAIIAALKPKETPYFYYLSDKNGVIHYAENFEDHKKNKALYLR